MSCIVSRYGCYALLIVFLLTSVLHADEQPDDRSRALLERVTKTYLQSRQDIQSVECTYFYSINGLLRECRYARSGEKFYHAGINRLDANGWSLPDEMAWDGKVATSCDYFTVGRSQKKIRPADSCPVPEEKVQMYIVWALGFDQAKDLASTFRTAREMKFDDEDCIELTFDVQPRKLNGQHFRNMVLLAVHSAAKGYWPVYSKLFQAVDGTPVTEMHHVQYGRCVVEKKTLFYPVWISTIAFNRGVPGNRIECSVDVSSLRLNKPIPDARFVIEPRPNQQVNDADTLKTIPAADPNWSGVGRCEFPWDVVAAAVEAGRTHKQD